MTAADLTAGDVLAWTDIETTGLEPGADTLLEVARRAAITRETLRRIENGTGDVRLDSMFAVLEILGILHASVEGASPFNNDAARARIDDILLAGGEI